MFLKTTIVLQSVKFCNDSLRILVHFPPMINNINHDMVRNHFDIFRHRFQEIFEFLVPLFWHFP